MGRPKEYEDLIKTDIMVERDAMILFKQRHPNLSGFVRDAMEKFLGSDFKSLKYVKKSKFELLSDDFGLKWGQIILKRPHKWKKICQLAHEETGKRFFRGELWTHFKKKYPKIGEKHPKFYEKTQKKTKIIDKSSGKASW